MPDVKQLIAVAKGDLKADLLLKNCKIVNTLLGEIKIENIAVSQGRIIGFGNYKAIEIIDIREQFVAPSFIDGHVHIESSMLTPEQFAYAIVKHGTTTIIADPHEIVNVLGLVGLEQFIEMSKDLPVDIHFMMPSCVPATHMETAAQNITSEVMAQWLEDHQIFGLGEMMNFPGVIFRDEEVLKKIKLFKNKRIDGHAPLISGKELSAYLCAGISTDHESMTADEALEKLEKGMFVLIREGSAAKNLETLIPAINEYNSNRFGFCTDDRHPDYLVNHGHINEMVKKSISMGLEPIRALQIASLNTAQHYGLKDIGSFGIGNKANFIVFDNFEDFHIEKVFKNGRLAVNNEEILEINKKSDFIPQNTINIPNLNENFFKIKNENKPINIIELIQNQIITNHLIEHFDTKDKFLEANIKKDLLKISVIERHLGSGKGTTGFVKGFGLRSGAISSTVAHDSHNLIILGTNDADMHKCVEVTRQINGGLVVVNHGEILATLPLPFGGIISTDNLEKVNKDYEKLLQTARSLGCNLDDPFMMLSFLALPVIPNLKITDKGLVDVNRFDFISLYQEH